MSRHDDVNTLFNGSKVQAPAGFEDRVLRAVHAKGQSVQEVQGIGFALKWALPVLLLLMVNLASVGLMLWPNQSEQLNTEEEVWVISGYEWMSTELDSFFIEE